MCYGDTEIEDRDQVEDIESEDVSEASAKVDGGIRVFTDPDGVYIKIHRAGKTWYFNTLTGVVSFNDVTPEDLVSTLRNIELTASVPAAPVPTLNDQDETGLSLGDIVVNNSGEYGRVRGFGRLNGEDGGQPHRVLLVQVKDSDTRAVHPANVSFVASIPLASSDDAPF